MLQRSLCAFLPKSTESYNPCSTKGGKTMSKVYKMIVDDKPVFNVDMIREDKLTEQLLNDFDRYVDLCDRIDRKLKIISRKLEIISKNINAASNDNDSITVSSKSNLNSTINDALDTDSFTQGEDIKNE